VGGGGEEEHNVARVCQAAGFFVLAKSKLDRRSPLGGEDQPSVLAELAGEKWPKGLFPSKIAHKFLCRVPPIWHSAKYFFNFFKFFAECPYLALGKVFF